MERGTYVKVRGCAGVACVVVGHGKAWEPCVGFDVDDEGNEFEVEVPGEGEWVADESVLCVRMVGDDHVWSVDPEDCKPLDTSEFCMDCGQTGCAHGRYGDE